MRRCVVFASAIAVLAMWLAACLYLLDYFRGEPPIFFDVILTGIMVSALIVSAAKKRLQAATYLGNFPSRVDSWSQLQRKMRRMSYGPDQARN